MLNEEAIQYYIDHPYEFVCDQICLPASKILQKDIIPTFQQKDFLDELAKSDKIAVKSGHGPGKTSGFAWAILWFMRTRPSPLRVPCTAPTEPQLYSVLWPEINRWLMMSTFNDLIIWGKEKIYHKERPEDMFAIIRTSNRSENMQGYHAEHLMWVADEAFGIEDPLIFEVIESSLTEGLDNKFVFGGNPTTVVGYCYNAFNKNKKNWSNITMNAEESPIVNQSHIEEMRQQYGRGSDIYRVRVLGEFPLGNPEAFFTIEQVREAMEREIKPEAPIVIGVDVARYGDDLSVIATRAGRKVYPLKIVERSDIPELYQTVLDEVREKRRLLNYQGRVRVKVDDHGVGGGLTDLLNRNQKDNIEVFGINYNTGGNEFYSDTATMMWAEMRDVINQVELPKDDTLLEELTGRITTQDSQNRIKLEPKKEYRKRMKTGSPDRADATVLAFAEHGLFVRVWPDYHPDLRGSFRWPHKNVYVSVFQERDSSIYGFVASYLDKLYIHREFHLPNPTPEDLAMRIPPGAQAWGNDKMFPKKDDAVSGMVRRWVRIRENTTYNEQTAILATNRLFVQKMIYVHTICEEVDKQFRTWHIHANRPQKDGFGHCYALMQLVAQLKLVKKVEDPLYEEKYSKNKREHHEKLKITTPTSYKSPKSSNDWMI
jgi:hypothetical protein